MTAHNALEAHARDEIGITDELSANPIQAAFWSALAFVVGGIIPVLSVAVIPNDLLLYGVPSLVIILPQLSEPTASFIGGASPLIGAIRVCFWGVLAMLLTALVGNLFDVSL